MATLTTALARAIRYLRGRRSKWSLHTDRQFHDEIFARQDYDPFDRAYPGNITIRRFADLASEYVAQTSSVADLGCGPGEITCELASRFPGVAFHGWDHSGAAVERARQLARTRGLHNISFDRMDVNAASVDRSVGLVTMFDAFHHLLEPERFLALNAHVPRWFLVEPAGDTLGRWRYSRDFDWVLLELDKLRWRLEHELGATPHTATDASAPVDESGAVEFRYGLADYERLFAAFGLRVVGTTSGVMTYPPGPLAGSPFRRAFNELAYQMFAAVDSQLQAAGEDLEARHWAIYCAKGEVFPRRRREAAPRRTVPAAELQGPYGAEYHLVTGPDRLTAGERADLVVSVRNLGFLTWQSPGDTPFLMSYHWRLPGGPRVVLDGLRTPLARPVAPGDEIGTNVVVHAPDQPGRYLLEIELVHEGVTWLSQAGQPPLVVKVKVDSSPRP
jgi:SAM-dependent methyltransferase